MIRRPPRSTLDRSSAATDVYKRQGPRLEELGAALPFAHLAEIEDERAFELMRGTERGDVVRARRVESEPERLVRDVLVPEGAVHEIALLGREEAERTRQLEPVSYT